MLKNIGSNWALALIQIVVLIQLTRAVGGKGLIQPELAAWIPSLLFGAAGAVLLRRTRT